MILQMTNKEFCNGNSLCALQTASFLFNPIMFAMLLVVNEVTTLLHSTRARIATYSLIIFMNSILIIPFYFTSHVSIAVGLELLFEIFWILLSVSSLMLFVLIGILNYDKLSITRITTVVEVEEVDKNIYTNNKNKTYTTFATNDDEYDSSGSGAHFLSRKNNRTNKSHDYKSRTKNNARNERNAKKNSNNPFNVEDENKEMEDMNESTVQYSSETVILMIECMFLYVNLYYFLG